MTHDQVRLPWELWHLRAGSILEIPCGDPEWMATVIEHNTYYPKPDAAVYDMDVDVCFGRSRMNHVRYVVADATDRLPECDVVLCRGELDEQLLGRIVTSGAKWLIANRQQRGLPDPDVISSLAELGIWTIESIRVRAIKLN